METKIKTSQLTGIIKQVVRESLQQREYLALLQEVSPPGKKAERMIQHVKKSLRKSHPEWDEEKITSVAIATGWKSHNKGNVEESKDEWEVDKGMRVKKGQKAPHGDSDDPPFLDPKGAADANKRVFGVDTKDVDEAGLTSEEGGEGGEAEASSAPESIDDEETDEQVNDHIAALLKAVFYSERTRQLSNTQKVALVKKIVDQGIDSLKEASYKKVSPNETDTSEEDKAREIQTDPEVNEAAYKVVAPNEVDVTDEDKARTIQTEPKVTENHKVQARSAKTAADLDNDPENVRDPEVPQA